MSKNSNTLGLKDFANAWNPLKDYKDYRQAGFRLEIQHVRNHYFDADTATRRERACGGMTEVIIHLGGGDDLFAPRLDVCVRCSESDAYNKRTGRLLGFAKIKDSVESTGNRYFLETLEALESEANEKRRAAREHADRHRERMAARFRPKASLKPAGLEVFGGEPASLPNKSGVGGASTQKKVGSKKGAPKKGNVTTKKDAR